LGSPAGIPLRLHFSFFLLTFLIFANPDPVKWGAIILSVFACVVLHEYGHALTARKYGVPTRDITLYPIGGVAMLKGQPKPLQEFWIALAGPAVNVVIAILLVPIIFLVDGGFTFMDNPANPTYLQALFLANVVLPVFNMIPAYPMDGGRVLRAILAMLMREDKAGVIAARIGQVLAIGLGLLGIFTGQFILAIISIFIFLGASQEVQAARWRPILARRTVGNAMISPVQTLEPDDTLDMARQMVMMTRQRDIPVTRHGAILGLLTAEKLQERLQKGEMAEPVGEDVDAEPRSLKPSDPLEKAFELFYMKPESILIMEEGLLHGLLTPEKLSNYVQEQRAQLANS
jgi:Zn-dependent protease